MSLSTLQSELSTLSHSEDAIKAVRKFCTGLPNTRARMAAWNAAGALIRSPLELAEVEAMGFTDEEDRFVLLQGDVVSTDSAYFLGARVGKSKFLALNSSCDLAPGRASCSLLLPLKPVLRTDPDANQRTGELAKFTLSGRMYIPRLQDDSSEVVCYAVDFGAVHQIHTDALHLADRVASLSLLGWRIFGAFSRMVFSRANPREVEFRETMDSTSASEGNTLMPLPHVTVPTAEIQVQ